MNHYIYKITNNINGKIYIGKRSCKCDIIVDTYFGSGIALKSAIKKYGKENFTKTILNICESDKEAYEIEKKIVDIDFLKRTDTYNLCGGGIGPGFGEVHPSFGKPLSEETKLKISVNHSRHFKGKHHSQESKEKLSINCVSFKGKHHTDESKTKMSISQTGKRHSEETKLKMSVAKKGTARSPESIAKYITTRALNKSKKELIL